MSVSTQDLSSWILSRPPLDEFTALVRSVADFFAVAGVDVSHLIARLIRAAYPEIAELAADLSDDLPSDAEIEINACYRQLRALAAPKDSAAYGTILARLRALQEDEARRIGAVFQANVGLDSTTLEAALRRADGLLSTHEDPADHD